MTTNETGQEGPACGRGRCKVRTYPWAAIEAQLRVYERRERAAKMLVAVLCILAALAVAVLGLVLGGMLP